MSQLYEQRGVSASKQEVHRAIAQLDPGLFPRAFCKVLPDWLGGSEQHALIQHADTAGTKPSLAYLYWKETGDMEVWRGIVQDALVMNLDDLLCAGVTGPIVISNTLARNKHRIPGEVLEALIGSAAELAATFQVLGIPLEHAGGETADVGDIVRTLDVGFTATARLPREQIMEVAIQPGDVIVGLSSSGQTTYEAFYNSGIGSNGLTAARHELLGADYAERYPETYSPETPAKLVYRGPHSLTDTPMSEGERNLGQLILSPTRPYGPVLVPFLQEYRHRIHGLVHCTGGGQTKCLNFAQGVHIVKNRLFIPPPLFLLIAECSGASARELYQTFNMGHRMEVYTDPQTAEALIAWAETYNLEAQIIGGVEALPNAQHPNTGDPLQAQLSLYTPWGPEVFYR